ncbi:helicase C-terminal domain-containing protein [Nocardia sp. CDC153]|uniref:helicase C-terminal domain-containing protein n=1 Tax=Nocardia sp. CDC153 TaxID=3112167 RepID=UPI002DB73BE6|nr:helicase C-terminal domain-containing protein [Nocardia sp. CDC153]MEC3952902.1 helicase C-terminal domain-containing protein [Nocardia sp. CDC153]
MTELNFADRLAGLGSKRFSMLRPAQAHVLQRFAEVDHGATPDIAVELPTGEGKTLIALLIADWALDKGLSVAYLTGNRLLATQVQTEACALPGIDVHRFESGYYPGAHLSDYHQAQAVGAMNYWTYFNHRPRVEPAELVIFDDAHLAEQPLADLFTLRIPRAAGGGTSLYREICDLILQQTSAAYPTLQALRDGTTPPGSPPELITFNDWSVVSSSAADSIGQSPIVATGPGHFAWRSIGPYLERCGVLIGPTSIEIRPYHPPTQTIPGYAKSKLRLYLSATIGEPGDLQRRLGVQRITAIETPEELRTASTGRRTFLISPLTDEPSESEAMEFALDQASAAQCDGPGRVAWLCASHYEADKVESRLETESSAIYRLRAGDDTQLDAWRASEGGHLVTAGRFDGMDFPDEVCRLVIIPSVPAASTEFERFVVAYLSDATFMRHRVGQRITQALGRANRTETDSALYIGLDPAFSGALADSSISASFGSDVRAVVRTALDLHDSGWDGVRAAAEEFWRTHRTAGQPPQGKSDPQRRRPGRAVRGMHTESSNDEVEAVTSLWIGDYTGAARQAGAAAEALAASGESEHSAFWRYVQAHALFLQGGIRDAAAAISQAMTAAPRTAWFVRLARTADELTGETLAPTVNDVLFLRWDQWIREVGAGKLPGRVARARGKLLGSHDERAEALEVLAPLCGAEGSRPTGQSASDALWVWTTPRKGHRRVWEIKTGTGPDAVPREDINQLLGQVKAEESKHPAAKVIGCLLTVLTEVAPDAAAASSELALLHIDAIETLFDEMASRFTNYVSAYGRGSAKERGMARDAVESTLPQHDWLSQLLSPSHGKLRRRQDVVDLFRKTRA